MPIIDVTYRTSDAQLTTTAMVKSMLGSTSTGDDSMIDLLITQASRWAETYVGYPLSAQRYLEVSPAYGSRRLMLTNSPLRGIANGPFNATDTGTAEELTTTEFRVNSAASILDRNNGWDWSAPPFRRPFGFGLTVTQWPGQEEPTWLNDYVAGYTYGGISTGSDKWTTRGGTTSTGRTLPEDIERAVILKTITMFEGNDGVAEKWVGDLRVRYGSFEANAVIVDQAQLLLVPYRRIV